MLVSRATIVAPASQPKSEIPAEPDVPEFLSGLKDGVTDGGAIEAVIYNRSQRSVLGTQ